MGPEPTGILLRRGVRTQVTHRLGGGVPREDTAGGGYHGLNCVPHPVPNSCIEAPTPTVTASGSGTVKEVAEVK